MDVPDPKRDKGGRTQALSATTTPVGLRSPSHVPRDPFPTHLSSKLGVVRLFHTSESNVKRIRLPFSSAMRRVRAVGPPPPSPMEKKLPGGGGEPWRLQSSLPFGADIDEHAHATVARGKRERESFGNASRRTPWDARSCSWGRG